MLAVAGSVNHRKPSITENRQSHVLAAPLRASN